MVVLRKSNGYILLESLISLAILLIIVSSYLEVTNKMQQESQQRLMTLKHYRDLYTETHRCRLHSVKSSDSQIDISFEEGKAFNQQGAITIVKK
ncbi:competence type IV pilus minor pilin ComGE [Enterococcus dongliensis]|uniref:competence type IV pilus minor pilin ComGE n=1 Tax=Enterococcus dongliensis TaxID=2559925 RepID=UPI0028919176|nr:competence type IV pilus minor pilin ComGE [Enterococcus dongliensis]MDT2612975.1 competence type IV pilus minor pilin ComGE [Enterococcus dongliensis]